jgi:hypothetical protein
MSLTGKKEEFAASHGGRDQKIANNDQQSIAKRHGGRHEDTIQAEKEHFGDNPEYKDVQQHTNLKSGIIEDRSIKDEKQVPGFRASSDEED